MGLIWITVSVQTQQGRKPGEARYSRGAAGCVLVAVATDAAEEWPLLWCVLVTYN